MLTFRGYRRADGRVGVRNHVLFLPTIVCADQVAEWAAHMVRGTAWIHHQHGCAQIGADREQTMRTFVGFGANPNVYGVVVLGLGCEGVNAGLVAEQIAALTQKPVELVTIQDAGGTLRATEQAARAAALMVRDATRLERAECPFSDLIVATECGGSDAFSGLTANPAVGNCADRVIDGGGTVILAETTELIGAEHLLAGRMINMLDASKLYAHIKRREDQVMAMGADIRGGNPAPGNIAGGLTTLEEKSLGAAHKGGTRPIAGVISYAERPGTRGLVIMDTPGHDIEQVTGMLAGGAQVVLFTTGRGTPTGTPIAPVIKIATNTAIFERMKDNIDFNAGTIATGDETVEQAGARLLGELQAVVGGQWTRSEVLGHHEFGIERIGPTV